MLFLFDNPEECYSSSLLFLSNSKSDKHISKNKIDGDHEPFSFWLHQMLISIDETSLRCVLFHSPKPMQLMLCYIFPFLLDEDLQISRKHIFPRIRIDVFEKHPNLFFLYTHLCPSLRCTFHKSLEKIFDHVSCVKILLQDPLHHDRELLGNVRTPIVVFSLAFVEYSTRFD